MATALSLGERGRLTAPPNPWVGCVLERDGQVVGAGFHRAPGEPHAEVVALADAGEHARGATAWVTLEPCSHHGRTPPCTGALLAAGVTRVVVALTDPDPRVSGQGIEQLRAAGVSVEVGPGAEAARESLRPYLHHRSTGRPLCVLKAAMSLDGRTAAADGTSRWITGPEARADTHRLRAASQAVVIGAGTALADRPMLNVRLPDEPPVRQPTRVLLDSTGRVPATGPLFDPALAPTLVVTTPSAAPEAVKAWLEAGAEVVEVPSASEGAGVDLLAALTLLADRGVLQAMMEGGPTLHGALVRAGLADRIVLYVGGRLLGAGGLPVLAGPGPSTIAEAPEWRIVDSRLLGADVRLDCEPAPEGAGVSPAVTAET
ncbi:MAG TPA: bifunctional diaminohydroxyphosphoribosylaminopyrimidine deaminase/5-amino-6-(5-phosphoribosylamino)uracil reductase RibD [Acidimicrobiia bacterium]